MKIILHVIIAASLLAVSSKGAAQVLTDITVFGAQADGNWANVNIWETRPGGNYNVWIQAGPSGGPFLTGPSDANAQPSIGLVLGNNTFRLLAAPGADTASFGINLFFNGSSTPSISAFGPMLTAVGPHSFAANGAPYTPTPSGLPGPLIPGAGTLSFIDGGNQITLTDFYWAQQSVYGLDLIGETSVGPDSYLDYVGGITLTVTPVPEPSAGLLLGLAGIAILFRRVRRA